MEAVHYVYSAIWQNSLSVLEDYVCARQDLISIEFSQFRQRGNRMRPCQECPHFCRVQWNLYQLKTCTSLVQHKNCPFRASIIIVLIITLSSAIWMEAFWENCIFFISTVFYVLSRQNLLFVRSLREHSLHIRNASTSLDVLFLHTTAKTLFRPNVHQGPWAAKTPVR